MAVVLTYASCLLLTCRSQRVNGDDVIQPVTVVRDLGVHLDAELTMKQHISLIVSSCFFQLKRLRQVRRSAGGEDTKRLATALVLSRLDYCNAALAGLPG